MGRRIWWGGGGVAGGGGECSRASIRKINVSKERGE